MNCPYCNNEMEKGLIQSPHEISWLKGENASFLDEQNFIRIPSYCLSCHL